AGNLEPRAPYEAGQQFSLLSLTVHAADTTPAPSCAHIGEIFDPLAISVARARRCRHAGVTNSDPNFHMIQSDALRDELSLRENHNDHTVHHCNVPGCARAALRVLGPACRAHASRGEDRFWRWRQSLPAKRDPRACELCRVRAYHRAHECVVGNGRRGVGADARGAWNAHGIAGPASLRHARPTDDAAIHSRPDRGNDIDVYRVGCVCAVALAPLRALLADTRVTGARDRTVKGARLRGGACARP